MTKYRATIERKVVKTSLLTYEFESCDSVDHIKGVLRNGEADSYASPIEDDYFDEEYNDRLLALEPLNEDSEPLFDLLGDEK